jgi:dephospho-CoA kinase
MLRVALTGGVATGKSYCLSRFAALGIPTIDADQVAREIVAPGTPELAKVVRRFGPEVLRQDGTLDRQRLGGIVFADPGARRDLETILHPVIYKRIKAWLDEREKERGAARGPRAVSRSSMDPSLWKKPRPTGVFAAIADIPLLFETKHHRDFDFVIVTACRPDQQVERLVARGGLSEAQARQRIDAQLPLAEKTQRANYIIDTSMTPAETDRQIEEVWKILKETAI